MTTDGVLEVSGGHRIFEGTFCDLLAFEIELRAGEFRKEQFWEQMGVPRGQRSWRFRTVCGSRNQATDYHLHLLWKPSADCLTVNVEFAKGHRAPESKEGEPLAEDFMKWLRQFVMIKEVRVDTHSDFEYPAGRRIKFPLPLRAPIGPEELEAEIDGISFRLSPPPAGVEKVWLTQEEEKVSVHLHAERIINFDSFDPRAHVLAISGVLDSLFEPRPNTEQREIVQ